MSKAGFDAGADADLAEGAMRLVETGGTKILLARIGGLCRAVAGICPHAGAPLDQGVLQDGVVTCPWHKAAFRISDGRCVAPPAVDDLARYEVTVKGGRLLVRPAAPIPGRLPPADPRLMLIVGAGAAGTEAARTLRAEGFGGRVLLVGNEERLPYDRTIQSKYVLSGLRGGEKSPLHDAGFYAMRGIERIDAHVVRLDAPRRRAVCADGQEFVYDAALLATGGEPVKPKLPGANLPGVFLLRRARDGEAIVAACGNARHAVVIGAGFIGMEAAASLAERGLSVTVTAPQAEPLEKPLGPKLGAVFRRLHEQQGVRFVMGQDVVAIEGDGRVQGVRLASGALLPADLVIAGLGIRPSLPDLPAIGPRPDGGLDVDAQLRVADGLYAAGDIAAFPLHGSGARIRVEHWRVAQQHGRIAALNMLGRPTPYQDIPVFWTIHFMKRLDYVGHADSWDELAVRGTLDPPHFLAFFLKANRVAALAGWDRDRAVAAAIPLMAARQDWTVDALEAAIRDAAGDDDT